MLITEVKYAIPALIGMIPLIVFIIRLLKDKEERTTRIDGLVTKLSVYQDMIKQMEADNVSLEMNQRIIIAQLAIPISAILMDADLQVWIAPEILRDMRETVDKINCLLKMKPRG